MLLGALGRSSVFILLGILGRSSVFTLLCVLGSSILARYSVFSGGVVF